MSVKNYKEGMVAGAKPLKINFVKYKMQILQLYKNYVVKTLIPLVN